MTRYWIAANLILLTIAGLLGWRLTASIKRFNAESNLAKVQPVRDPKQKITLEGGLPPLQPFQPYNAADFGVVSAQNLFSDTRTKEEKAEAAPAVPEVPPLAVKPILVGVTLFDDQRLAAIVDPTLPPSPRGRPQTQTKRLGDTFQGYTITDISPDQMVLERGSRREVIPLFDSAKHPAAGTAAQGGKTTILLTRVVAFGGGGSAGVAQPVTGGARPATAAAPSGTGAPVPASSAQSGINRASPGQPGRQVPAAQPVPLPTAQPAGGPVDQPGRRIIRTPFGDIPAPPPNF